MFVSRAQIARTISTSLGAPVGIDALASGLIGPGDYMPENEGQYWQFRRYLHDIICFAFVDNGTFKEQTFRVEAVGLSSTSTKLTRLKPDLYTLTPEGVHIGEVTATYSPETEIKRKKAHYEPLLNYLEQNEVKATLDIIVLDLTDPEWVDSFSGLPDLHKSMLSDFIDALHIIHSNPSFGSVRKSEFESYNLSRLQYKLEDDTVVDSIFKATGVRLSIEKINSKIDNPGLDSFSDDEYLTGLANSIINSPSHPRPYPDPRSVLPELLIKDFESLKLVRPTTNKVPKLLQLGCPMTVVEKPLTFKDSVSALLASGRSGGYLSVVMDSLLREAPDPTNHTLRLPIFGDQLEKEQMQGPGRKAYMKKHGITIPREAPKHIGISDNHPKLLESLIEEIEVRNPESRNLEIQVPDMSRSGVSLSIELESAFSRILEHPTSFLLNFYQLISNEIVINSMRRRKQGEYVLGYSGVSGVYFLVAPGPQLRTESTVEFIKIISLVPSKGHGLSISWHMITDHWESDWLSVDIDRLKHWQRAFDRVTLSMMCNAERIVRPGVHFRDALKEELNNGNYTLLALTYLEDKQLTSVTNQTLRYFWMKSIGDKDFSGLMGKFPSRVNSVIQSTMIQRSVNTCIELCKKPLNDLVTVSKLDRDEETGLYDETTTGITNLLPRIFTRGPNVPISYNLNEIYWCMAYNKDRQNAVQDSLKIIEKIVNEESKYASEIDKRVGERKVDYFLGNTSLSEDIEHSMSKSPESHFFSARAVLMGVKFQSVDKSNLGDRGTWLNSEKLEAILSKPLSDYATFKASVKQIARHVDTNDLNDLKKIGVRTKAIELVAEILENEDLMTAADVAMSFSGTGNISFEIFIQVFKKGQIGGVREIIILWIKARVMMNIMEEVARLQCKSDKREILTKGRDKRLMMRGDHEEVVSSFKKGTPIQLIKESYDMTTWCQKFIPVIFIYNLRNQFSSHPGMKSLSTHIFLEHSNKKIEFPRKLVEQWCKNRDVKHENKAMQGLKEKFLSDGVPYLVNHSNMCQGIPHYNSSVIGLTCMSFGEALFRRCLELLGQEQSIHWRSRLGSDDKGTIIGLDMSKPTSRFQAKLLGQAMRVSERLHSMELSIKSASGHLMYELNSAFMANLETLSPTIKFSLAATDSIETSSCSGFVQESYSRIRQLRENGCSSLICSSAHMLNERHFYSIFGTGPGGHNDLQVILGLPRIRIPYDFGVYPTYDSDIQEVVGPEYHNYRIMKTGGKKELEVLKLLYTELSVEESDELFRKDTDDLLKKDHFGIQQGLVRQLVKMRERTHSNSQEVDLYFQRNPFIIIRGPKTRLECLMLVKSKLFTKGAAQSLRRTSPAIYIGRLAAYRSSSSWKMTHCETVGYDVFEGKDIQTLLTHNYTYKEFLEKGLEMAKSKPEVDFSSLLPLLFPNYKSLDVVSVMSGKFGALRSNTKKFSQAVRHWTVNNFNYEYTSSLRSILQTSFSESMESSKEDVEEFKKVVGLDLKSLEQFKEDCMLRGIRPLDMFFYMTRLYKLSKTNRIQTFANGPSSNSLHMTILTLKRYNHMPGMNSEVDGSFDEDVTIWQNTLASKLDDVKIAYNLIMMSETGRLSQGQGKILNVKSGNRDFLEDVRTTIRSIKTLSGFDWNTQKSVKLCAAFCLPELEFRDKLISWKDTNFTYIKRQRKNLDRNGRVSWSGDLCVLVSSGNECYTINEVNGKRFLKARQVLEPHTLYKSLSGLCKTLGMELNSFLTRRSLRVGDIYLSDVQKMFHVSEVSKVSANALNIRLENTFPYRRIVDMSNFRVVKNFDRKLGSLSIHLEDKFGISAVVCHSSGGYYPVELPKNFEVDDEVFYQGVRLSSLLRNKQWFYNRRIPQMTESDLLTFLREDIDYETVLGLVEFDKVRIKTYMEVREEVNEESFGLVYSLDAMEQADIDDWGGKTVQQVLRDAMEAEARGGGMRFLETEASWADEVNEMVRVDTEQAGLFFDEETILVTRAFGYKAPKAKKSTHVVNTLQQGAELRMRVLDCFFRMGSVKSEQLRLLPSYVAWLKTVDNQDEGPGDLANSLIEHMVRCLSESTGVSMKRIEESIDTRLPSMLKTPLSLYQGLITPPENFMSQEDMLGELYRANDDYNEEFTDDDEE